MTKIKLMTFNTLHCLYYPGLPEQRIDYNAAAKAILDCDADIIGLNEMRSKGNHDDYEDQVGKLSELTKIPHRYFAKAFDFGDNRPYGNAFLSKIPIKNVETILIPDPDPRMYDSYYETRCVLKAELENGLTVLVTHFGLNPDEQENAVETILANLKDEKCILMGDFNVYPDNNLLKPIYEKMKDASSLFKQPLFSYPSENPRVKIDYIFVSPDIEIIEADIPAIGESDHRPHIATINFADDK